MNVLDSDFKKLFEKYQKAVIYGLSPDAEKTSHHVAVSLRESGWDLVGTYPKVHHENQFQIYQSLKDVPAEYRKFVDVFRSSDRIAEIVDEVLAVGGVEVLWLQLGITNPEAEKRAEAAGIQVVSNRCLLVENKKWLRTKVQSR